MRLSHLHVILFAVVVLAWTIALLSPVPHESAEKTLGSPLHVYLFGKSLHVAAYAGLTVLGGTAVMFGRKWVWVLPGLVAHGAVTECIQPYVGRTGAVRDVGLDTLGIILGGLVVLAWRRIRARSEPSPE